MELNGRLAMMFTASTLTTGETETVSMVVRLEATPLVISLRTLTIGVSLLFN
jgi:hypothetical protein